MAKNDLRDTTCPPPEIDPNKYGVLKRETAVVTPPFRTLTTRGDEVRTYQNGHNLIPSRDEGLEVMAERFKHHQSAQTISAVPPSVPRGDAANQLICCNCAAVPPGRWNRG